MRRIRRSSANWTTPRAAEEQKPQRRTQSFCGGIRTGQSTYLTNRRTPGLQSKRRALAIDWQSIGQPGQRFFSARREGICGDRITFRIVSQPLAQCQATVVFSFFISPFRSFHFFSLFIRSSDCNRAHKVATLRYRARQLRICKFLHLDT